MSKFKYSYPKRYSIEHLLKKISSDISIFSLFYRIFYFFILFLPSLSFSETGKTEFDSIQKVAQYILNNYPKNKTVYIGVGRSPVPVIAYLQTEEGTLTQNLPLSNFRYNLSKYPKLDSEESLRLYSHFNNYFPSEYKLLGRNEILLIDYSVTGKTLNSTQEHLDQYFKVYQKKISKIHALGIASQQNENKLKSLSPSLDVFILNGYPSLYLNLDQFDPFLFMMAFELYKDRAEFEGFNIKNPRQLRPRKKYEDYVLEIKSSKLIEVNAILTDPQPSKAVYIIYTLSPKSVKRGSSHPPPQPPPEQYEIKGKEKSFFCCKK